MSTPGPWKLSTYRNPEIYSAAPGFEHLKVCSLPQLAGEPANPRDADLIAEAPNLLALIGRIREVVGFDYIGRMADTRDPNLRVDLLAALERLRQW